MPNCNKATKIEVELRAFGMQHVECGCNVLIGARISATRLVNPSIFDIPCGDAPRGECGRQNAELWQASVFAQ